MKFDNGSYLTTEIDNIDNNVANGKPGDSIWNIATFGLTNHWAWIIGCVIVIVVVLVCIICYCYCKMRGKQATTIVLTQNQIPMRHYSQLDGITNRYIIS